LSIDLNDPTPRPVRLGPRTAVLLAVATALGAAIVAGGILSLYAAGHLAYLSSHSRPIAGTITSVIPSRAAGPDGPQRIGRVQYSAAEPLPPGASSTGSFSLEPQPYLPDGKVQSPPRYHAGDPIKLRLDTEHGKTTVVPADQSPSVTFLSLSAFGLVLIGLALVAVVQLWRVNLSQRRLLSRGVAFEGEVVGKRLDAAGGPHYYIRYAFKRKVSDETEEREERCTAEQWRRLGVEHPVTVLVDPDRPEMPHLSALIHVHE